MPFVKEDKNSVLNGMFNNLMPQIKSGSFLFVGQNNQDMIEAVVKLARFVNCSLNSKQVFDDRLDCLCPQCQLINKHEHPDVCWIKPRGTSVSIKIEDVRYLKERVYLKPFQATKKIFIIDQAQSLTPQASNALLKILEEPAQDTILILLSLNASLLLPTVVSRCQLIRFPQRAPATEEQFEVIDELACRIFEQKYSFADNLLYDNIARLIRDDLNNLLQRIIFVFRDILMLDLRVNKDVLISGYSYNKIRKWADFFSIESAEYLLEEIMRAQDHIKNNANIKLTTDLLLKTINKHKVINR